MGRLEKEVTREVRRTRVNQLVITTLAVSGVLAVGIVAPQVLGAMGKFGLINSPQKKQSIKKSFNKLAERDYIKVEKGKARLTTKGERFAALLGEGRLAPKKPRWWDKKWRVLIFDIPERRRKLRLHVRTTLTQLGFERLQDSVWIYPYDCEDLITLFKVDMRVGNDLRYMVVDKLENDTAFRAHFGLVR